MDAISEVGSSRDVDSAPATEAPSAPAAQSEPAQAETDSAPPPAPDRVTDSGEAAEQPHTQASPDMSWAKEDPAVQMARQYEGTESYKLKGEMPNFQAAGGKTNNCADFVSSVLQETKGFEGHPVSVKQLKSDLTEQGWRPINAADAQPGDVRFGKRGSHVELVTQPGGTSTIGSNNDRPNHQVVFERPADPRKSIYYAKRQ